MAQGTLLDLHGPPNVPLNGPCETDLRGPLEKGGKTQCLSPIFTLTHTLKLKQLIPSHFSIITPTNAAKETWFHYWIER